MKYKIYILVCFCLLSSCSPETSPNDCCADPRNFETPLLNIKKSPMEIQDMHIEIYSEIDTADKSNWTDRVEFPDGSVEYMGKQLYKPYVKQCIYTLNEKQKNILLETPLRFLPYFREVKEDVSLYDFLQDPSNPKLYPKNLDGYITYNKDEDRAFFSTIIEPTVQYPQSIIILRNGKDIVYINDLFYTFNWESLLQDIIPECNDQYQK
jgi:hypothetical protein